MIGLLPLKVTVQANISHTKGKSLTGTKDPF